MSKIVITIFSALILLFCSIDPISDYQYPTTFHRLSDDEMELLQESLDQSLGTLYKASLNQFGFLNSKLLYHEGTSLILDPDSAVSLAKETILYFSEFNNVVDASVLKTKSVIHSESDHDRSSWLIIFENQSFQGLEILSTDLQVLITDSLLEISGFHFKDIYIPHFGTIPEKDAIARIWNEEIEFFCRGGQGSATINEETIIYDDIELVIIPLIISDFSILEVHVAWKIPIEYENGLRWDYFIDVVTGKTLTIHQRFRC